MPPGSKKKSNGKKGKSKKRCDSKNDSKEDDLRVKEKNKENCKQDKDNNEFKAQIGESVGQDDVRQEMMNKMENLYEDNEQNIDELEEEQNEEQDDEEGEGEGEELQANQPFTEQQPKEDSTQQDISLKGQCTIIETLKPQQQEKQLSKLQFQLQQQQLEIDESRILHKIEQIKAKLKDQQFFLMGDKDLQTITTQLASLLKTIPSKFNTMSTEKLLKEKERQKGLLITAQQLSEQFLNYISIANKKLNPKDSHLQNYQSWITQTIQKKNKKRQSLIGNGDDKQIIQEAGNNLTQKKTTNQGPAKLTKDFMGAEQKEFLREMEEKFIKLDKTKHITASKLKNTAKHISNISSQIKQLKQDNTTQTARNSILGSTTGNIQTLRDAYDQEIKYLKSKQLQESTKNRVLAQKLSELEQQEEKIVEKSDKNTVLLESLEQNMAKFGDNQKIFSNYYKIRELKEKMQRIVLDLKNQQRFAEKQSEKKAKTLRYAQKNISEVQRAIEEKTNEIAMFNALVKEITLDPFSCQQIIREKPLKTYSLPQFFAFDYHLPQHLCADIFEIQQYLDTQALLNETYQINLTPRCPSYARPLQDEQVEEKKIKSFIQRKASISRLSQPSQQLLKFTSKADIQVINQQQLTVPMLNSKTPFQEQLGLSTQQLPSHVLSQDELERNTFSSENIIFPVMSDTPSLTELNGTEELLESEQIQHRQSYSEGQNNQPCLKAQRNFIQRTLMKSSGNGGLVVIGNGGSSKQINSDSKINLTKSSSQLEINPSLVNDFVHGFLLPSQRQSSQREPLPQQVGLDQQRIVQIEQTSTMIDDLKSLDKIREALKQRRSVLEVDSENRDSFQRQLLSRNGNHIIKIKNKDNNLISVNLHHAMKSSASKDAENNQNQENFHKNNQEWLKHEKNINYSSNEVSVFQISQKQSNEEIDLKEERSQSDSVLFKESEIHTNLFTEIPQKIQNNSRPFSSFELQKQERINHSDQIIFSTERGSTVLISGSRQKQQQQNGVIRVSSPLKLIQKSNEKDIQVDQARLSFSEITQNEQKLELQAAQPLQTQEQISESKPNILQQSSNKVWEVNSKTVVVRTTKQTRDIFSKITRISATNNSIDITTQINQRLSSQQNSGTKVLTSPSKSRQSQMSQQKQEVLKTEGKEDYSPREFTDSALKSPEKIQKPYGNISTIPQKRWTPGIVLKRTSNSVVSTPQKQNVSTSSSVFRESGLSQSQMKLALNNERSNQQQQQQKLLVSQDLGKQNDKIKGVISFLKRSKSVFNQEDKGNNSNNGNGNSSNCQNNTKKLIVGYNQSKQQPQDQIQMQIVMNPDIQNNYYRPKGHGKRLIYIKSKDLQFQNSNQ